MTRNLQQYPVTWDEKFKLIDELIKNSRVDFGLNTPIGGVSDAYILRLIGEDLHRLKDLLDE